MKTMEDLRKAYNLGRVERDGGRFYSGKNQEAMRAWAETFGDHQPWKHYAAKFKQIMKEDFGLVFSCSGKWLESCGQITATLKARKEDVFKPWDELTEDERKALRALFFSCADPYFALRNKGYVVEEVEKLQKKWYEEIYTETGIQSENGGSAGLKEGVSLAFSFAAELLDSWNYDHTGNSFGDCDYCDRDFYEQIGFKIETEDVDRKNEAIEKLNSDVLKLLSK